MGECRDQDAQAVLAVAASIIMKTQDFKITRNTIVLWLGMGISLFLASFNLIRSPTWSMDVLDYQLSYELINSVDFRSMADFIQLSLEPAFVLASIVTGYVTRSVNLVLFLFAFASLTIKLAYIPSVYVKNRIVLIVTYTLTYYFLLELTQSRIAVASAFILLGYHFLVCARRGLFLASVALGLCFHYTAIIALLALFFYNRFGFQLVKRHLIFLVALFFMAESLKSPFVFSLIELLDAKKSSYISDADTYLGTGFIRIFLIVAYQLLVLVVCRPSLLRLAPSQVARFHALLFHLYASSISIYIALHSFGVVAVRLAEVFRNLEPFLLVVTLSYCQNARKPMLAFAIFVAILVNLQKNSNLFAFFFGAAG